MVDDKMQLCWSCNNQMTMIRVSRMFEFNLCLSSCLLMFEFSLFLHNGVMVLVWMPLCM